MGGRAAGLAVTRPFLLDGGEHHGAAGRRGGRGGWGRWALGAGESSSRSLLGRWHRGPWISRNPARLLKVRRLVKGTQSRPTISGADGNIGKNSRRVLRKISRSIRRISFTGRAGVARGGSRPPSSWTGLRRCGSGRTLTCAEGGGHNPFLVWSRARIPDRSRRSSQVREQWRLGPQRTHGACPTRASGRRR